MPFIKNIQMAHKKPRKFPDAGKRVPKQHCIGMTSTKRTLPAIIIIMRLGKKIKLWIMRWQGDHVHDE